MNERMSALLEQLNCGLFDKEDVMAQVLLSSIAGDGIFLLGPPGVAKSLVARRLKFAFTTDSASGSIFEYLMNRFSTSDEIFGPVSISKLKNQDKYERNIAGYLPSASIVFLDEIWKAGPAIQNALLTILNEKIFRNGDEEIKVPLKALISASNGLPAKGEGLEALWDRFLVRLQVGCIDDDEKFIEMITANINSLQDTVAAKNKITEKEYREWNGEIENIEVNEKIRRIILYIKNDLIPAHNEKQENEKKTLYVSDRRWKKIIRLLRTSAFLNGRKSVNVMDCFLIKNCIWDDISEIESTSAFVDEAVNTHILNEVFNFDELRDELSSFLQQIMNETHVISDTRSEELKSTHEEYYTLSKEKQALYIKKSDYDSLNETPAMVSLYREIKLSSGYLSHNQADIIKKKLDSFTVAVDDKNINLENSFVFDRSASVTKGNAPFSVNVDEVELKIETTIVGERRRRVTKAEKVKERIWDKKIKTYLDYVNDIRKQSDDFVQHESKEMQDNLFIAKGVLDIPLEYLSRVKKECDELEMQILEIQHTYKKIQDNSTLLQ
jgi:MoxR-like ATPase